MKNLTSTLLSDYKRGESLFNLRNKCVNFLGREFGVAVFSQFIKENKDDIKLINEFNSTSFDLN